MRTEPLSKGEEKEVAGEDAKDADQNQTKRGAEPVRYYFLGDINEHPEEYISNEGGGGRLLIRNKWQFP